jgi:hypothetical protein
LDIDSLVDCLRSRGIEPDRAALTRLSGLTASLSRELLLSHFMKVRDLGKYFRNYAPEEIARHLKQLAQITEFDLVTVTVDDLEDGSLHIVVAGADLTGVSACITGYFAELQLSITHLDLISYIAPARPENQGPGVPLNLSQRFVMVLHARAEWQTETLSGGRLQSRLQSALKAGYWHLLRGDPRSARLESPVRDELTGVVLDDRFRLERPLSEGATGTIYLATQTDLGRPVAVKMLKAELCGDPGFVEHFEREARLLAQVQSVHVVQVYAVGVFRDRCWMALQYMAGGDVAHLMSRGRVVTFAMAARWLQDSLRGLCYLHREVGIVHQDIKPSNLLLDAGQSLKITDFGLSQVLQTARPVDGSLTGTPLYMAPEQARGERTDCRSDLFSLGSSFYHILTGVPPFDAGTPAEVLAKVGRGEVEPLRRVAPDVPAPLAVIVDRLLQPDPEFRYQDASVALVDLESYLPGNALWSSSYRIESGRALADALDGTIHYESTSVA